MALQPAVELKLTRAIFLWNLCRILCSTSVSLSQQVLGFVVAFATVTSVSENYFLVRGLDRKQVSARNSEPITTCACKQLDSCSWKVQQRLFQALDGCVCLIEIFGGFGYSFYLGLEWI